MTVATEHYAVVIAFGYCRNKTWLERLWLMQVCFVENHVAHAERNHVKGVRCYGGESWAIKKD